MTREETLAVLRGHQADLRKLGVSGLCLFGSVARGDAGTESDIDLFFDYDNPRFSLIELIDIQNELSRILDAPVDVTSRKALHPLLKSEIESSAIVVF